MPDRDRVEISYVNRKEGSFERRPDQEAPRRPTTAQREAFFARIREDIRRAEAGA